jgi:hypothetical protein
MHHQAGFLTATRQPQFSSNLGRLPADSSNLMQGQMFDLQSHSLTEHPFLNYSRQTFRPKALDLTQTAHLVRARSQNFEGQPEFLAVHPGLQRARSLMSIQPVPHNQHLAEISPDSISPVSPSMDFTSSSSGSAMSQQTTRTSVGFNQPGDQSSGAQQVPFWNESAMWKNSTPNSEPTGEQHASAFDLSGDFTKDLFTTTHETFSDTDVFTRNISQAQSYNMVPYTMSPVSPDFNAEFDTIYFGNISNDLNLPDTPPEPVSASALHPRRFSESPSYRRMPQPSSEALNRRQSVAHTPRPPPAQRSPSLLGKFSIDAHTMPLSNIAGHVVPSQARRKSSKSSMSSHGGARTPRRGSCEFVNYTAGDSHRILKGVAPSGSSKTKLRREREEADKRRKLAENARIAVEKAGGDPGVIGEEFFM